MGRWLRRGLLVVGLLAVLGYGAGSWFLYDNMTLVSAKCSLRSDGTPRFSANTPASFSLAVEEDHDKTWPDSDAALDLAPYFMPDYQSVTLASRDPSAGPLSGWWVPGRSAISPAVVVVHGIGSCKRDHVVLLPAGMLHRAGFGVLLVDLQEMGDSAVQDHRYAGGSTEYQDVLGARDWITDHQGLPASKVGLVGMSLGAATVIIAAGEDGNVAATWEDSGYGDTDTMIREEIPYRGFPQAADALVPGAMLIAKMTGLDPASKSPLGEAAKIGRRPFAVVHGVLDDHINVHHATDLAAVVARSVPGYEPWLVSCAHHVEAAWCDTAKYESRLVDFFTGAIGAP